MIPSAIGSWVLKWGMENWRALATIVAALSALASVVLWADSRGYERAALKGAAAVAEAEARHAEFREALSREATLAAQAAQAEVQRQQESNRASESRHAERIAALRRELARRLRDRAASPHPGGGAVPAPAVPPAVPDADPQERQCSQGLGEEFYGNAVEDAATLEELQRWIKENLVDSRG